MKKLAFGLMIGVIVITLGLIGLSPVLAAPLAQEAQFATPTPEADGRIRYLVESGDTLSGIASLAGVSVDNLLQLNGMTEDDVLIAGTYLILGIVEPPESGAQPGSGDQPTPTAIIDSGMACVLLYLDINGDAVRQNDEIAMADGEVSVSEQSGLYFQQGITTYSPDPLCFTNLPPGSYEVVMTLPEDYFRTTDLTAAVELNSGDTAYFSFGMSPNEVEPAAPSDGGFDPMLIIGGILLVIGAGGGIYAALASRRRTSEEE
jgi:LysM repeat protein